MLTKMNMIVAAATCLCGIAFAATGKYEAGIFFLLSAVCVRMFDKWEV